VNDEQWHEQRDAKERAASALSNAGRSTALPRGLQWLTGNAVRMQSREIRRNEYSGWAEQ